MEFFNCTDRCFGDPHIEVSPDYPEITSSWCSILDRRMYHTDGELCTDSLERVIQDVKQKRWEVQHDIWSEYVGE